MTEDSNTDETTLCEAPTRRDYVKYGGAVVGGGLLAGCLGSSGSNSDPTEAAAEDATETAAATEATAESIETEQADESYEACIEPAGCLTFEAVPESWLVYNGGWADMAFVTPAMT